MNKFENIPMCIGQLLMNVAAINHAAMDQENQDSDSSVAFLWRSEAFMEAAVIAAKLYCKCKICKKIVKLNRDVDIEFDDKSIAFPNDSVASMAKKNWYKMTTAEKDLLVAGPESDE